MATVGATIGAAEPSLAALLRSIVGAVAHCEPVRQGGGWGGRMWGFGWCRLYAQVYPATHIQQVVEHVSLLRVLVWRQVAAMHMVDQRRREACGVVAAAPRAFFSLCLLSPSHLDSRDKGVSVGVFCANMAGGHAAFQVGGEEHPLGEDAVVVVWDGRCEHHRTHVLHRPLPPGYAWYGMAFVM